MLSFNHGKLNGPTTPTWAAEGREPVMTAITYRIELMGLDLVGQVINDDHRVPAEPAVKVS
jgi:hypothetical protein